MGPAHTDGDTFVHFPESDVLHLGDVFRTSDAILGADLEVRLVHREASPEQVAFLETQGDLAQVVRLRAMARGDSPEARLTWKAQTTISVGDHEAEVLLKLLDVLDDNDDWEDLASFTLDGERIRIATVSNER